MRTFKSCGVRHKRVSLGHSAFERPTLSLKQDVVSVRILWGGGQNLKRGQQEGVERHAAACGTCRQRLASLGRLDAALGQLGRIEPPSPTVLHVRRAILAELRGGQAPELMTLDEVAGFLRISLDELEEIVLELPAFELAGQLRVRRSRLLEWTEAREHAWTRCSAQSEVARILAHTP